MYFSLPQLFVFLFDVLSVAVFVIRERLIKKKEKKKRLVVKSCSLCNKVLSISLNVNASPSMQGCVWHY